MLKLKPIPKMHMAQFNAMAADMAIGIKEGTRTFYRYEMLRTYTDIVQKYDPTHNPNGWGKHVGLIMEHLAARFNGYVTFDASPIGNPKKRTVRIEIPSKKRS